MDLTQFVTERQKRFFNFLVDEIRKFELKGEHKEVFEKVLKEHDEMIKSGELTKEVMGDLIETLKYLLEDLKIRKENLDKAAQFEIFCNDCEKKTLFIGSVEELKKYWICMCGSDNFKIVRTS